MVFIFLCKTKKIRIPAELYNYIIYKIYKDMKNNKLESYKIFKGKYIFSNKLNKKNIVLSKNDLLFILSNNLISKYIKNYRYVKTNENLINEISRVD